MRTPSSASTSSDELAKQRNGVPEPVEEKHLEPVTRANDVLEEVRIEDDTEKPKRPELHQTVTEERRAQDADADYPKSWRLGVIFMALCLAVRINSFRQRRLLLLHSLQVWVKA